MSTAAKTVAIGVLVLAGAAAFAQQRRNWGPEQATGAPDTFEAGDRPTAWATWQANAGIEWLRLECDLPADVAEVRIRETFNPGAVCKVALLPDGENEVVVWEGEDPTTEAPDEFAVTVEGDVMAQVVKVYLDTRRRNGWNEIDAVALVARNGTVQWAVQATASSTYAEPPRQTALPPRVVAVDPPQHATGVDPALSEIRVTFDRPMATERSWSWMQLRAHGLYPGVRRATPRYDETGRTCILPARLQPGQVYAVGINSPQHMGFRDEQGVPAVDFAWAFATADYEPDALPPQVIGTSPEPGATDVDPALGELSVTFDRPMVRDSWSWIRQAERGEYPGVRGGAPQFSEDGLTCRLPVALQPDTVYAIGVNSFRHTGFSSEAGVPALPYGWAFKTGPAPEVPPG